jgi:hypothetical protein
LSEYRWQSHAWGERLAKPLLVCYIASPSRLGGPHELEARHRCVDSWPRLDACAGAAAIHAAATANASSAVDHSPNPSLHGLRDELRHRIGHVPKRLQRQQFACSDVCRGSPRRSRSMLSKLLKPTARLQTGLPSSALTTRCRDHSFVRMRLHSASARDRVVIVGARPVVSVSSTISRMELPKPVDDSGPQIKKSKSRLRPRRLRHA